jgi:anti-sigma factor ChrR (cupin superfamily)
MPAQLPSGITTMSLTDADFVEVPRGLRQAKMALGDVDSDPVFLITRMPPNTELPRHHHEAVFVDAIAEGSLTMDGVEYPQGTVRFFPAGAVYGPQLSGPGGCVLLEFYATDKGSPAILTEGA